ncbi:hypothetical protein SAMD00019534_059050, partial [Acytostelium subglobosum LB1]|uniref:hypothetical protein n=1 Tax=Acytostelium subglobosum LB1 TaxID=1410327 RepID=UPI0006447DC1
MKWTPINGAFKRSLDAVHTSVVYCRGSVYVFGGFDSPMIYSRYSLSNHQCERNDIVGISGGNWISTCYDGNHHIYLVGGDHNGQRLNRVDCFDIVTGQFSHIGHLPYSLAFAFICFHNNSIIVVGGAKDGKANQDILSFNIQTHDTEVLIKSLDNGVYDTYCYDGKEYIYVLSKHSFMRYSLDTTKPSTARLALCPTATGHLCSMIYDQQYGIVYLGGTGLTYHYSTQDNKWTMIDDQDNVNGRYCYGACLIRD